MITSDEITHYIKECCSTTPQHHLFCYRGVLTRWISRTSGILFNIQNMFQSIYSTEMSI